MLHLWVYCSHKLQPDSTKPCHQTTTYPVSRRLPRNHRAEQSSCRSFSGHQKRQRFSFLFVAHLLCDSPPRALPVMQSLHQMRNGRRVQFFSVRLVVEDRVSAWSSFLQTLPLPPTSSVPLTSRVQHRPPPRSSSRILPFMLHTLFWSYGFRISSTLWFTLAAEKLASSHSCSAHRTSQFSSFSSPLMRPIAFPPDHWNALASARVLNVQLLRSEHDDISLAQRSQLSFDVRVQELHVPLLAIPHEFQSRISFHMYRNAICCR